MKKCELRIYSQWFQTKAWHLEKCRLKWRMMQSHFFQKISSSLCSSQWQEKYNSWGFRSSTIACTKWFYGNYSLKIVFILVVPYDKYNCFLPQSRMVHAIIKRRLLWKDYWLFYWSWRVGSYCKLMCYPNSGFQPDWCLDSRLLAKTLKTVKPKIKFAKLKNLDKKSDQLTIAREHSPKVPQK